MFDGLVLELTRNLLGLVNDSSFYLVLGFLLAGLVRQFVSTENVVKHLGNSNLKSIFKAALIGAPLPLCSCGVIPAALSLRQNGASKEATLSFLISTPETGVDSIAISYALLDPIMTVFRPVAAVSTAIFAGLMEKLSKQTPKEKTTVQRAECDCCESTGRDSMPRKLRASFEYAFIDFFGDIALYLLIGFLLAALVLSLVPAGLISDQLGGTGIIPMVIMLVLSIPLYICSTSATPIAAALILKGASPGVALVLLLGGPATNLVTMVSVGKFLGIRSLLGYLLSIIAMSFAFGLMLNFIYGMSGLTPQATMGQGADLIPSYLKWTCTAFLLVLSLNLLVRKIRGKHIQTCRSDCT